MVGLMRVSHLAHRLEDLLVELRAGTIRTDANLTDAMLQVVDGMGRLIAGKAGGDQDASDEAALELLLPSTHEHDKRSPPTAEIPSGQAAIPTPPPAQPHPQVAALTLEVPLARIDELNRLVGEASAAQLKMGGAFGSRLHVDPDAVTEYRDLTKVLNQLQEVTERTRMVPVGTLEPILHRTARDAARTAGKNVRWEAVGQDIEVDRGVLEELASPLLHLVRNSIGHGVELPAQRASTGKPEQAVVRFRASQAGSKVVIEISDDGAGIDVAAVRAAAARVGVDVSHLNAAESLRLIFGAGISTAKVLTEESGRGVGLDVVATAVAKIHGTVEAINHPGRGAEFRIVVPITLTVVPCLIVSVAGQPFAVPLHRVVRIVEEHQIQMVSGVSRAVVDGQAVPISDLATVLGMPAPGAGPWVLLGTADEPHAFQVEAVLSKRDVVVRGLTGRLRDLEAITGASVEPNGSILLVLDVSSLIARGVDTARLPPPRAAGVVETPTQPMVMVVDDTLMVRELQRSMLERAGYLVRCAGDGAEALAMLGQEAVDLVVTDLEMPNLDGFQLTGSIRANPRLANIPVLIVSSHVSDDEHRRGLESGADGYIVKAAFDEAGLLAAVSGLLGRTGGAPPVRRRQFSPPKTTAHAVDASAAS